MMWQIVMPTRVDHAVAVLDVSQQDPCRCSAACIGSCADRLRL
jgi:hypothetical protein